MDPALWIAKTGVDAQQKRMAVISNNLANVNTNGFKRGRAVFEDLLYQNIRQVGGQTSQDTQSPSGVSLGAGVRTVATQKMHTQGNVVNTGNNLDIAIQGRGFFQINMPDGTTSYTRDGSFQTDSQGQLVTSNGYAMSPSITLPANTTNVSISGDGIVEATVAGSSAPTTVGTLQLADFINPAGLEAIGENLYKESVSSGSPQTAAPGSTGLGSVTQGFVESSNVNVVEELVNMIEAQRAYEMNSKAISATDDMLKFASQQL
jgi:flagellar basal-body rod protein FlgG